MRKTLLFVVLAACGGARSVPGGSAADARFAADAEAFYWAYYAQTPHEGVELGYHQYDGQLPAVSPAALAAWGETLARAEATLGAYAPAELTAEHRLEREVILRRIKGERFGLERRRLPRTNPMYYLPALQLTPYVARDYAPLAERARGVIALARATRAYLRQAAQNLERRAPSPWIQTALLQLRGGDAFLKKDVPAAFAALPDRKELDAALAEMADAGAEYAKVVAAMEPTGDFALGERDFLDYLEATEGVRLDLATLERIGNETLERDSRAAVAAAAAIDPKSPTATVVRNLPRPPVDGVLATATRQSADMRQFLVDKDIVSIPSDDPAEVRETPPFMRWNSAFLDGAGVFEPKPLPSFYYITPPEPEWPREQQLAFLDSEVDLLFTTVHEVWPGHFLHRLHLQKHPSRIMKSFCSYQMGEGWAHYTEQMMWEAGVGDGSPAVHLGQLDNALLRDVRFVSAIGLHARGMTVEASARLFRQKAFAGDAVAMQQAVRGTFDPLYLNYTLGKLIIYKLRDDWRRQVGDRYSLKAFHNALLGYACAPLPVIRREMVGDGGGLL